jgi:hypothetical protein
MLGGDDLPEALAAEVFLGEREVELAVVADEVFGYGVGHDFVHVDADALAGGGHGTIIGDALVGRKLRKVVEGERRCRSFGCALCALLRMTAKN